MASSRGKEMVGQESLLLDGRLSLPDGYDQKRAKAAAKRRSKRLGKAALARTKGFRQRTDGLFIPVSGTENTSVVAIPETKVRQNKQNAKDRLYEKYEDSDVPDKKLNLWAFFSMRRAEEDLRQRFRTFMFSADVDAAHLKDATFHHNGEIHREAVETFSDTNGIKLAYPALLRYVVQLEAFSAEDDSMLQKSGQPKWAHERHTRKYAERQARAEDMLQMSPEQEFCELVDEAYWNNYSRYNFWKNVYNKHRDYLSQRYGYSEDPNIVTPLDAYAGEYY